MYAHTISTNQFLTNSRRSIMNMLCLAVIVILPVLASGDNLLLGGLQNLPNMANIAAMNPYNALAVPNFNPFAAQATVTTNEERIPCSCGVFLNGQFRRGSNEPPQGNAALLQELTEPYPCNALGEKQCTNKCLETIMRHLPNSPLMVCGSIDRDCHKERAYLFVKNCKDRWINTNLSAGREYCCKDGAPYKCPPS